MSELLAIDVAILPPPDVSARAIALSAALPAADDQFRLDDDHLPHVTLAQLFVRENELEIACDRVGELLRGQAPLRLRVAGGGRGSSSVWLTVEPTAELVALHERVMEALRGVERQNGGPSAFFGGDARVADVLWVAGYRLESSFGRFVPHITLGRGAHPPEVEPFAFSATDVAVCHLGRYCTCRRVLRRWTLTS